MDENLQQVYSGLAAHCNKMKEGKYLMSTGTMTSLLRYITSQPALMSCLEKCNYGFRYATELETAMSGGIFKLPLGSKKIVALVTGLLFEMVRGGVNFHNFIKKYVSFISSFIFRKFIIRVILNFHILKNYVIIFTRFF